MPSATLINKSRRPFIIGFRKTGAPIWSIAGGAPDDDDDDDGDGNDDAARGNRGAGQRASGSGGSRGSSKSAADSDTSTSDDKSDDSDGDEDPASLKRRLSEIQNEAKKHRLAKRDVQKELDAAKQQLAELSDKEKDSETRLTEERDALKEKAEGLEKRNRELRLHVAFLSDNSYEWHDPDDALRLADLNDVEIDEDGTVIGLEEALKDLAKRKPHLIKTNRKARSAQSGSRDDDGSDGDRRTGDTGAGGTPRETKTQLERQRLADKYRIRR